MVERIGSAEARAALKSATQRTHSVRMRQTPPRWMVVTAALAAGAIIMAKALERDTATIVQLALIAALGGLFLLAVLRPHRLFAMRLRPVAARSVTAFSALVFIALYVVASRLQEGLDAAWPPLVFGGLGAVLLYGTCEFLRAPPARV